MMMQISPKIVGSSFISARPAVCCRICGSFPASQVNDKDSVFSYYKQLIRLRKEIPVIVDGAFCLLLPDDEEVFAYHRKNDEQTLTVLCNFYGNERTIDASALIPEGSRLLLSNYTDAEDTNVLRPYEARMYLK